jgi:hypothetical protein
MEIDEVTDAAKTWLSNKLKNPYFAAVLAIWLVTNRVVVFSLFNFPDEMDTQQRISLIHQQFENKTVLFFSGFYGIVLYSFIVGFISMIVFNYLNVFGKWGYNFFGKTANNLRHQIEPHNWVARIEVEKIKKKGDEFQKKNEQYEADFIRLKQENTIALDTISKLRNEKEKLEKENTKVENLKPASDSSAKQIQNLATKIKDNSNLSKAFGIINYHIQGGYTGLMDSDGITSDLLAFFESNDIIENKGKGMYILTEIGKQINKALINQKF